MALIYFAKKVLSNVTSGGVKLIKKLTPRRNSKETNGKLETK
ncbi:8857_t:CDS:2 [Rhizophagus irregularis]|nr:8857_t:CDS:2 [Rhizophagus irregularis]